MPVLILQPYEKGWFAGKINSQGRDSREYYEIFSPAHKSWLKQLLVLTQINLVGLHWKFMIGQVLE